MLSFMGVMRERKNTGGCISFRSVEALEHA